jgi:NAD(P)-dependent dehydrogenase (short-subunit alcohol dehydrogenase family)
VFNLKNKVVLVVGGRGYLGRDFCYSLSSQGAIVISLDMKEASAASLNAKATKKMIDVEQVDIDVTNPDSVKSVIKGVVKKHSKIDVVVYSVSAKPDDFYLPYTECQLDGWHKVIHAELDGAFLVTKEVGKVMEQQKGGSIILLSSIYGVVGNDQRIYKGSNLDDVYLKNNKKGAILDKNIYSHAVYPVVKGGLISLARYLAAYWGDKNIRVNCISPGGVSHEGENEAFVKKYSYRVPLGRKAEKEEISGAVVFLSSDEASYINGQNIIIDGGWTAW